MDKVKVGIIGVGYLGTQHARILSYLEEAELKGVADIDFKKAMQIGNRHGVQYYENFEEMLDEIDAGIGGSMADVVGAKLREVANSRQVICITHLPQIAALADLHLAVGKVSFGGRTVTHVMRVDGEARVKELTRMIGGKKPTTSARLHAEEILKKSEV